MLRFHERPSKTQYKKDRNELYVWYKDGTRVKFKGEHSHDPSVTKRTRRTLREVHPNAFFNFEDCDCTFKNEQTSFRRGGTVFTAGKRPRHMRHCGPNYCSLRPWLNEDCRCISTRRKGTFGHYSTQASHVAAYKT